MVTPVLAGISQCGRNVLLDLCSQCKIITVKHERGEDIRDVEPQPDLHDAEAGLGELPMLRRLIAPELVGSILVE